jgi:hypothetical protein
MPQRSLEEYIRAFAASYPRGTPQEKRVLVFATTLYPTGPAERAFLQLAQQLPDVQFDVVAARYAIQAAPAARPANVHLYCAGFGISADKYFLPILGAVQAYRLSRKHRYLFAWSILASYGAIAGAVVRRLAGLSLLVTLADQRFDELSALKRGFLRIALTDADQVYGTHRVQEEHAAGAAGQKLGRRSLGDGDAFANQLRYAYTAELLAL